MVLKRETASGAIQAWVTQFSAAWITEFLSLPHLQPGSQSSLEPGLQSSGPGAWPWDILRGVIWQEQEDTPACQNQKSVDRQREKVQEEGNVTVTSEGYRMDVNLGAISP